MTNYLISFKINDYNPKLSSISYNNYICILIYENFKARIPLTGNESKNYKHLLRNIKSDLHYKITLFDEKIKTLIGINDFIIPYKVLFKINPNSSFIYEKELKFIISMATKLKIFGPSNTMEDIHIKISAKIFKKEKYTKLNKIKNSPNNKYLSPGITERASFIQKTNGNYIKSKVIVKKNRLNKNKDEYFSSDSNKLISTNDLSGNRFNTYSINDENENSNTNTYINNISTINNIINRNYYCFNTSGNEQLKIFKNNISNLNDYKNKDIYNYNNYNNSEGNEIIKIKNKLKKRITFSNDKINNKIEPKKKHLERYYRRNTPNKNINNKLKTRNSFMNSYRNNRSLNFILNREDDYSLGNNKNAKSKNEDKNFHSCESYSNKQYLNTETKKIKKKYLTRTLIHKNKIEKFKNISLSKGNNSKTLYRKKRGISEYILNKDLLSTDRLLMNPNNPNINEKYILCRIRAKNNKKMEKIRNYFSYNNIHKNNNIYLNQNNNIKEFNKEKEISHNNKDYKKININNKNKNKRANNNINQIKVTRKTKSNNNTIKNKNIKIIKNDQSEIKKYVIQISKYFTLNNRNMKTIYLQLKEKRKKIIQIKELFFSTLKKSNRLKEQKSKISKTNYILKTKNNMNKKIKIPIMQIKKREFKIFKKIFNISYTNEEIKILSENTKILNEKILKLQLCIIKNMIEHYGNISQIYNDDSIKKEKLKKILLKNNIIEKENKNTFIDLLSLNKINISIKKIIKNTFNNDINYQFNIIKEVQEEKESEKYSNSNINKANNISSLINDISDEILFIDKKESDINEDNIIHNNKEKNITNSINNINYKNNYSNSVQDNSIKIKEDQKKIKKSIRKELIGMNKKKFKGKDLNFDEFEFDYYNNNKNKKKENVFKFGFFNKK